MVKCLSVVRLLQASAARLNKNYNKNGMAQF